MGLFRSALDAIKKGLHKTAEAIGGQLRSLLLGRTLSEELIDEIDPKNELYLKNMDKVNKQSSAE